MPSSTYSITPAGGYNLTTVTDRPNVYDPALAELSRRIMDERLRAERRYVAPRPEPLGTARVAAPPVSSASPAQHGNSAIGQEQEYGPWDPRNPNYVPMKEPVGLTAGMIPGMGENPLNKPLRFRPGVSQFVGGDGPSRAGLSPSEPVSSDRGSAGTGNLFAAGQLAAALDQSNQDYWQRQAEERQRQLRQIYGGSGQ